MATGKPPQYFDSPEAREKAIVRDYENDVSTNEIQETYEISPGQLYRILDKHGVKPRRGIGRPTGTPPPDRKAVQTEEAMPEAPRIDPLDEAVREDYLRTGADYMTVHQIRAKHGVAQARIQEIVRRLGLVRPDRPEPPNAPKPPSPITEAINEVMAERKKQESAPARRIPEPEPVLDFTHEDAGPEQTPVTVARAGYVFRATVEYRTRDTVMITASSVVDAARQAAAIVSPTGGPAEVVMLAREA